MYCPHCGVNNDRGEANCFICHKPMPSNDVPAAGARARPERREASPVIAAVGDRMIALLFDRIVVASIVLVLVAWAVDAHYRFTSSFGAAAGLGGAFIAVAFLYHFISEAALLTTAGKAAMGLHIGIEEDGNRLLGALLRNVLRLVDCIGAYLVGFLFATFSLKRQRIGDRAGHTVVLEWPIARGGRAAMMILIALIAAAAVWIAMSICPSCGGQAAQALGSVRIR